MFDDPNVVLPCEKIDKIYPGTKALDQVSFVQKVSESSTRNFLFSRI